MTLSDLISHGVTAGGAGAITAAIVGLARWARHRERGRAQIAVSEAEERIAREQGAVGVVEDLRDMLAEAREERRREREEDRKACDEHVRRELDHAERRCHEHTTAAVESATGPLRAEIATLAGRLHARMSPDDTGVHEIERIARRTPTPQPMPAQRDERETMLPPKGGERKDD